MARKKDIVTDCTSNTRSISNARSTSTTSNASSTLNIVIVGVGGQGVILASNIIMHHFLQQGWDAKRSEIHGMAQRGGSVEVHVRVGTKVYSPVVSLGEAQFLMAIDEKEGEFFHQKMKPVQHYVALNAEERQSLPNLRSKNIALLAKFFFILQQDSVFVGNAHFFSDFQRAQRSLKAVLPSSILQDNVAIFQDYFSALCP